MTINATSRWDAEDYRKNAAFVPTLGAPVVDLLDPKPGEHILDLGCGDGILTEKLVAAGAVVVAVDASPEMIAAARARGLDAHVMGGQKLVLRPVSDAVFSQAALHWMLDPPAVASGVFRALKPGGRFVGEQGGAGNISKLCGALREILIERDFPVPAGGSHEEEVGDVRACGLQDQPNGA